MPPWLNPVLHALQSLVLAGGVIALMVTGKIDTAAGVGILTSLGGVWAGVGGAAILSGSSAAATTPKAGDGGSPAVPAPAVTPLAPPPGQVPGGPPAVSP